VGVVDAGYPGAGESERLWATGRDMVCLRVSTDRL